MKIKADYDVEKIKNQKHFNYSFLKYIFYIFLFTSITTYSQTGTVKGKVTDNICTIMYRVEFILSEAEGLHCFGKSRAER